MDQALAPLTRPAPSRELRAERHAVGLVFLLVGTATGLWASHIPGIGERLGLTEGLLGLALFALGAGALVAMPLAGAASVRWGAGKVTLGLGLAGQAALPLTVLAPGLPTLLAAAFGLGVVLAGTDIAMNARAAEVERDWPRPIMSSLHGFFSLGGLLGAALGGAMVALGRDEGSGLVLWGAGAAAALLLARRPLLIGRGGGEVQRLRLPGRGLLGLGVLAFLCFLVEGAVTDWSALLLRETQGASGGIEVAGFAAYSVAMAACRFTGDGLVTRFGRRLVLQVGGVAIGVGMGLALLGGSVWLGALGFGLVGLGAANIVPVLFSAAAERDPHRPGAGIAAVATLGYTGFLLGPAVLGLVADGAGLTVALGLLVPMGVGIAMAAPRALASGLRAV